MNQRCVDRFLKYVTKTDTCWLWNGYKTPSGYGYFRMGKGRRTTAHRASFILFLKATLNYLQHVCHRCDNPRCVNPDHLFVGTAKQNQEDSISKNRKPIGEKVKTSKLTCALVKEIRRMTKARYFEQDELSKMFLVSRAQIKKIVERSAWRHVQ